MNLGEIISHADNVKPNGFAPEDKVVWLNELENLIQADVLQIGADEHTDHVWSGTWSGTGITFPDDATMVIPGTLQARPGGTVDIEGLTTYAANNGEGIPVVAASVSDGVTTITAAAGTFSATGEEPEAGEAVLNYDGFTETMLAPAIWHKIYYTYLEARIASANGEFGEYANTLQIYNAFMGEYVRWYARNNIDPKG
jgi:hypothetical protein